MPKIKIRFLHLLKGGCYPALRLLLAPPTDYPPVTLPSL